MFNKILVRKALKKSNPVKGGPLLTEDQDRVISLVLHNIFGGEILKTHLRKGWHFYNRINGERIDFTMSPKAESPLNSRFEDIPSTPEETCNYVVLEDYSTFYMRFIRSFEEAVGLCR